MHGSDEERAVKYDRYGGVADDAKELDVADDVKKPVGVKDDEGDAAVGIKAEEGDAEVGIYVEQALAAEPPRTYKRKRAISSAPSSNHNKWHGRIDDEAGDGQEWTAPKKMPRRVPPPPPPKQMPTRVPPPPPLDPPPPPPPMLQRAIASSTLTSIEAIMDAADVWRRAAR